MRDTLKSAWPLFFGLALLMVGNGLQGTLLGVRATMEGFSTLTVGFIMSLYYGGYLAGSILAPRLIASVGHIRVFAAMASLASTTSLLHGVFIDPFLWGAVRVITGFSFAALYIVVESWMNDIATKETRGKILAFYLFTFYAAMMAGQYLMNLAPPQQIELFVLTSVLVSIALLPVSLSRRPAPEFNTPERFGVRALWQASPLGVTGVVVSAIGSGTFFTIAPVYALNHGFDVSGVANFMVLFLVGGMLFQVPLGMVSDRMDRRWMIIAVSVLAAGAGLMCALLADNVWALFLFLLFLGGMCLALYPISSAYINDHLHKEQYVSASASIILVNGMGSFVGPFSMTVLMTICGDDIFFPAMVFIYALLAVYALYRMFRAPPVPEEERAIVASLPPRASQVATQIAEEIIDSRND